MEEFADDIALHERIFAQVLGVEENEKFAVELTIYAGKLLNVLPPGWNLVIGEGELDEAEDFKPHKMYDPETF